MGNTGWRLWPLLARALFAVITAGRWRDNPPVGHVARRRRPLRAAAGQRACSVNSGCSLERSSSQQVP